MTAPAPPRRQLALALLLLACLLAAYATALRLTVSLSWSRTVLLALACLLAAPLLLTLVVRVLTAPKSLAGFSRSVYRALARAVALSQYLVPWLGWSALALLLGGRDVTWAAALRGGALIALISYLAGFALVMKLRPRVEDVALTSLDVPIADLPLAFDGYRILLLSDLHGGGPWALATPAQRLAAAAKVSADVIVFAGDLAARSEAIALMAREVARLQAPDDRLAVLGNHDAWMGEERVTQALSAAGFRVLANEHIAVERDGEKVYFAGVKDASYARADDLPAALRGIPQSSPVILISHSPDVVLKPGAERAALTLAGHTHGGQVVFPWLGPLYVPTRLGRRRMAGLFTLNGRKLFITRGLGEVFPPLRLNCPPEIAVITLRASPASAGP